MGASVCGFGAAEPVPEEIPSRLLQGRISEERAVAGAGSSEGRRQPRLLTSLKPSAGGKTQ